MKDQNPSLWEARFGGHLAPEQTYLGNLLVEAKEELGIDLVPGLLKEVGVFKVEKDFEYQCEFILQSDLALEEFTPEEDEVEGVKYLPLDAFSELTIRDLNPEWTITGLEQTILDFHTKVKDL